MYLGRCHQAIAMEALQAKTTDILGYGCHLRKLENMIEMCSCLKGFPCNSLVATPQVHTTLKHLPEGLPESHSSL